MVVLERLSPDQRVAFVLHDGFAVPFPEIAAILGVSDAAARQLASRARRIVSSGPAPAPDPGHDEVVQPRIIAATVHDGKVYAVWDIANPNKFTASPLRPAVAAAPAPTESGTQHRS